MLEKLLKQFGVLEFSQLNDEEKETYRKWEEVLTGRKITDGEVRNFFDSELESVLEKLQNPNLSEREDMFLKMKMEFIRKTNTFLMGPENEKKALENHIKNNL